MKKLGSTIFTLFLLMSCDSQDSRSSSDLTNDEATINRSIEDWDNAWATKNLDLAIKHYANETDWTNAFGDRVRSKDELEELLGFIFNLDFVMAGENHYGKNEITFLNESTATVRSQNIRKNQKWADGSNMDDRYVNHLRVYQKMDGIWLITSHMISQAHKKNEENQLYFKEGGTGEAILFIHGGQEDYRVFMPQIDALKNNYRVITYSRRFNYPNSNKYENGDTYNPFTEAKDLESLINNLNTKSIHLVGHSYGGLIAMSYTHKNPDKVMSLTLSEPPLLRLPGCEKWYQLAQERLIRNVASAFKTSDTTLVIKALFEFFAGADIQEQVPPEILQSLKANLTEMEALVNSDNPFPDLTTNLRPPVMLLTSGNTMPMLNCTNDALVERMPQAKHVHIPDASHDMWITHPKLLSQYVKDFISGNMDDVLLETEFEANE